MGVTVQRARRLRNAMTDAERKLWRALKECAFFGRHIRRQAPIGRYIADFACHEARLVVELDGGQHAEDRGVDGDRRRTAWLESQGYRVLRFWNNDVLENVEGVILVIEAELKTPTPGPSPQGGGGRKPDRLRSPRKSYSVTGAGEPFHSPSDGQAPSPLMGEGWGGGESSLQKSGGGNT